MRDTHLLPRRAEVDAALVVEPVRAGLRGAAVPAVTSVELRDQCQPTVLSCVEVTDELCDLRFELAQGKNRCRVCNCCAQGGPRRWLVIYPVFYAASEHHATHL